MSLNLTNVFLNSKPCSTNRPKLSYGVTQWKLKTDFRHRDDFNCNHLPAREAVERYYVGSRWVWCVFLERETH